MTLLAVAAAGAVMAGAALQSAVGFGFALVAAPLLYAAAPSPEQAVGLMILLGPGGQPADAAGRAAPARARVARRRRRGRVVAARRARRRRGAARARRGRAAAARHRRRARALAREPAERAARGAAARTAHAPPARWARPAAGLSSGALNTSTSTGGPPVVLLLMSRGLRPHVVRDTLTAAFVGFAGITTLALALTGTDEAVPGRGLDRRARPAHRPRAARRPAAVRPARGGAARTSACSRSCSS